MKTFICLVLLLISFSFANSQTDSTNEVRIDKVKLYNKSKALLGTVVKVKAETVEFKELSSGLDYEFSKSEIEKITLGNGTVLTYPEFAESEPVSTKKTSPQVSTDSGPGAGWIIAGAIGGTLVLLIIIGAIAGSGN